MHGDGMGWRESYRRIVEFCRRLGGRLLSPIDTGLASEGEKLSFVDCIVPSRLDNRRLAKAIAEIRDRLDDDLRVVLGELGDFTIREEEPSERRVKYSPLTSTVHVFDERVRSFSIDPSVVEYVYPDAVEDYTEDNQGYILVRAKGLRMAFERGELKALASGHLVLKDIVDADAIEEKLNELDEMLNEILADPRNFFRFREE